MAQLKDTTITGNLAVTSSIIAANSITATTLYGTVGNDYAEFRASAVSEPGRCVRENNNGILTLTNTRLIPGASIISDTYGFSEGRTESAQVPIAVCGRVLAYPARDISNYSAGMAVCSAPDGTVDIMTREEIINYPDCIVGIVR